MASPSHEDATIDSVQGLLDFIQVQALRRRPDYHLRGWFRGQSDVAWELQPGVYRAGFVDRKADRNAEEADRLRLERHLYADFRVESAGILRGGETEAELYFLQQHYGIPTRLRDWTSNPLAGLFFAAAENKNRNGMLFIMDAYKLKTGYYIASDDKRKKFSGLGSSRHPASTEDGDELEIVDEQLPEQHDPDRHGESE